MLSRGLAEYEGDPYERLAGAILQQAWLDGEWRWLDRDPWATDLVEGLGVDPVRFREKMRETWGHARQAAKVSPVRLLRQAGPPWG